MQPFTLGRVLLITLPGVGLTREFKTERCRDEEPIVAAPTKRVRAAHVTLVHGETCCNVRVDLDAATDARTPEDVQLLRQHGFVVGLNGMFAHKTSVQLGNGIGDVAWPDQAAPKQAPKAKLEESTPVDGTRIPGRPF